MRDDMLQDCISCVIAWNFVQCASITLCSILFQSKPKISVIKKNRRKMPRKMADYVRQCIEGYMSYLLKKMTMA